MNEPDQQTASIPAAPGTQRILGLDLGTTSVGWAIVESKGDRPLRVLALGARIFPAGVEGSIQQGREESRNLKRRMARQARRQITRRRRRMARVYRLLRDHGFLPQADPDQPDSVRVALDDLDRTLAERWAPAGDHRAHQVVPYRLRGAALDQALEAHELGRALYHLAQRRGFRSNRREGRGDKEREDSVVKAGISELQQAITKSGARTLGAHLAQLDPTERRIRQRWTAREMYEEEFRQICDAQKRHHPELGGRFRDALGHALFHQRPLKSQKGLVGSCDLEPRHRRAPIAILPAQRARLLQDLNHLRWIPNEEAPRPLDSSERTQLLAYLEDHERLTFAQAKKLLGRKRTEGKFNLEEGDRKALKGNVTRARLRAVFGERWDELTTGDHERVVHDLLSIQEPRALAKRGEGHWGLSADDAKRFSELRVEDGYAAHSRRALEKLLPYLERGLSYAEARDRAYPERPRRQPHDILPPLAEALPSLRNPAVERTLTEMRHVVNSVIRRYGKPDRVRLELARDLKQPRSVRERRAKQARQREKEREAAKERLLREAGIQEPSGRDIEKALLFEECGGVCPYTGRSISFASLFGSAPEFDIEHILPYSRCLDNSFANKTLCHAAENRMRKGNRTPYEAYGSDPEGFQQILERVRRFQGPDWLVRAKLERFERRDLGGDAIDAFAERQLSDTRYASRLAADCVALLYGGRVDETGRTRVQVSAGGATALLRRGWGVNALLGDGPGKERRDHRHHALDATVIALTGPAEVKRIADAARRAEDLGSARLLEQLGLPWPDFRKDLAALCDGVVASHRASRRLRGALHEETLYGRPRGRRGNKAVHHVRRPVGELSTGEIESIVDPAVRRAVRGALEARRQAEGKPALTPKQAFADPDHHPRLRTLDGRGVPIHRVRVAKSLSLQRIPGRKPPVWAAPGANHHMAIVAELGANGSDRRWQGHVVTLLDAAERKTRGEPVIQRDWGAGRALRFALRFGDSIAKRLPDGTLDVLHVKAVSTGKVELLDVNDARSATEIRKAGKAGGRMTMSPERLRKEGYRKIAVDPLGGVRWASD